MTTFKASASFPQGWPRGNQIWSELTEIQQVKSSNFCKYGG